MFACQCERWIRSRRVLRRVWWREVAREYRDVFPDATLLVVEGAGHSIADARPVLYADVVRAFLVEEPLPPGATP